MAMGFAFLKASLFISSWPCSLSDSEQMLIEQLLVVSHCSECWECTYGLWNKEHLPWWRWHPWPCSLYSLISVGAFSHTLSITSNIPHYMLLAYCIQSWAGPKSMWSLWGETKYPQDTQWVYDFCLLNDLKGDALSKTIANKSYI